MNRLQVLTLTAIVICLFSAAAAAVTVSPPHSAGNGFTCASCHTQHLDLGSSGYDNVCLTCHRPGIPLGGNKPFTMADMANPLNSAGNLPTGNRYQTSHNWISPDIAPGAGAQPPRFGAMTTSPTGNHLRTSTNGKLACVRCHNQHDNTYEPFLRMANDRDQMCLDCHRSRNLRDHVSGTHPVNFNYTGLSSKVKTRPAEYHNPPVNANPGNPTSDLNARLTLSGSTVLCSTCHGVHYSDSNSATFDNRSAYYQLLPADGNLLRTDLRGATAEALNICTNCHSGKLAHNARNQNIQCADCHGAHVEYDPNAVTDAQKVPNVWLIKRYMNISTSLGSARNTPVYFQSTVTRNYKDANGTGVCQACHAIPLGSGYPDEHNSLDTTSCNGCHLHGNSRGAFTALGACNNCHGYPPQANTPGGPRGYAVFNGTPSPFTNESTSAHITHASGAYSRKCIECHQGNSHRSGTFQDVFKDTAGRTASSFGATPQFNGVVPTEPSCANVYCHSDGAPRNATLNPVLTTKTIPGWHNGRGAIVGQADECRRCHGDTTSLATNSHAKHLSVGSGCQVCHTVTVSNSSTISNFITHVNGLKDVDFGGTLASGGVWTVATATCSMIYCHSNVQGTDGIGTATVYASPVWGGAAPGCGGCHQDMAISAAATGSHKKHVQFTSISCATCHDGVGAGTTTHANGTIETSFSGRASGTTYSQANSPAGNSFGNCNNSYCHSNVQGNYGQGAPTRYGTPVWGGLVPCGSCHVRMDTDASATGSHIQHAQVAGYVCNTCHNGGGSGTTNHASGVINLAFTTPNGLTAPDVQGTVYSLGTAITPGTSYQGATCSNTVCHGFATPLWGNNSTTPSCDKCHTYATALPFRTTAGATSSGDAKAGTHTIHLSAASSVNLLTSGTKISLSSNLSCTSCHPAVSNVNQGGHLDSSGGAEIAFGGLAKVGGVNPVFTQSTGTCANTYCHGNTLDKPASAQLAPTWNVPFLTGIAANDCTKCHGYPPSNTTHAGKVPTDCITCHPHVNAAGTGFTDHSLHINGLIDGTVSHAVPYYAHTSPPYTSCTACHNATAAGPYPAAAGSAPNCRGCHLNADPTVVTSGCSSCHTSPPSGTTYPNIAGSHARHNVLSAPSANCSICHNGVGSGSGVNHGPGNHGAKPSTVDVIFSLQAGNSAAWNGTSCSGTYCHSTVQGATGTGSGVAVSVTWGASALNCGSCHKNMASDPAATGSHVSHTQSSGTVYSCAVCHGSGFSATAVSYPTHVNSSIDLSFTGNAAGTTYGKGAAFAPGSSNYGNCTASNCHGASDPIWGNNTTRTRCLKCHGYRSTGWNALNGATATTDTKAGAHFNHISSSGVGKISAPMSCSQCHTASLALSSADVNSTGHMDTATPAEITFGTLATNNGILTPAYNSPGPGQCANVYCHGASLSGGVNKTPRWNDPVYIASSGCSTCHGYPPATTIHVGKGQADCHSCHPHITNNGAGFTDPAKHINGTVDASGGHSFPYPGATHLGGAGTSPWTACTGCHTNGVNSTYPVAAGTAPDCKGCHVNGLRVPSGTSSCWDCHGASATDGLPNGTTFPNIASSHAVHAALTGVSCNSCHTGGGAGATSHGSSNRVAAAPASVVVAFTGQGAAPLWTLATKTCAGTNCHGQGAPAWGATSIAPVNGFPYSASQCLKCHGSATTNPFYSTAIPQVTINTNARVGAHTDHLFGTRNISSVIACSECHIVPASATAAGHMNGAVEVGFNGPLARAQGTTVTSCATSWCHGGNTSLIPQNNPARTAPAWGTRFPATSTFGTGGPAGTSGSGFCAQCHGYPPLTVIHAGKTVATCTGCHTHINADGMTFNDKTKHINGSIEAAGHSFPYQGSLHLAAAGTTPWSSCISAGCHTNSAGGTYPAAVGTAPNCTGCHLQGLRAPSGTSSCWDCHGSSATNGTPNGNVFPNISGNHRLHVAITGTTCATCHTGAGTGTTAHGSGNRTAASAASVNVAFTGQGSAPLWTLATKSCSATNCHGQGAPVWGARSGAPVNGFPYSTVQCAKCHSGNLGTDVTAANPFYGTAIPKVTANSNARVGAHTSHFTSTDSLSNAVVCADCHGSVTLTLATHMNGTTNFSWNALATRNGALVPSYNPANGQCSNVYCHGASMPGGDTSGSNRTPTWNVAFLPATLTAAGCGTCHGFPPPLASGHPAVTIPAGFPTTATIGTTCNCHSNISSTGNSYATIFVNKALHINGTTEVTGGHNFPFSGSVHLSTAGTTPWSSCTGCHTNTAGGTYPVAAGTAPNCTGCHLQGLRTPSGTSSCWDCHGASATDGTPNSNTFPNISGNHLIHIAMAGTTCATCHTGGGTGTASHGSSNRSAATPATVKVTFTGQGTNPLWTFASKSCSATNCHGQGTPVWGARSGAPVNGFPYSAVQCAKCHSGSLSTDVTAANPFYGTAIPKVTLNTNARVGAHTSHTTSTDSLSNAIVCSNCHGIVTLTLATHMNGTTNFTWSSLASRNGALSPSYNPTNGQCTNVYCHGASMPGGDTSGSNRTPTWNVAFLPATLTAAGCGTCHGFPPPVASGHPAVTIPAGFPTTATIGTTCSCHTNINTAGNSYANIFVNKALHIDGTLQVSGGHAVPYDTHKAAIVTAGGNTACLGCHAMGTAASPYPAAVAGNAPDCMSCHKKAAPLHSGTTAGANCSSCHGLSTATGVAIGRPVGTAYPDRLGYHGGASDTTHRTSACTVCHNGAGTTSGANSGINHGKGSTAGPVRNGKPNVVGPMVNGITPTNSLKGVGIPANGTSCVHGTISAGCSGGGTKTNRW